ncbi:hypothetical protein ACPA9J_15135 [Pseudomonas aeruginosa]
MRLADDPLCVSGGRSPGYLRALDPGLGSAGRHHYGAAPGTSSSSASRGPNGPLPLHLTELRPGTPAQRQRLTRPSSASRTSSTPPLLTLFYRAWAEARPEFQPRPDRRRDYWSARLTPRSRARIPEPTGARAAGGYRTLLLHRPPRRADPLPGTACG